MEGASYLLFCFNHVRLQNVNTVLYDQFHIHCVFMTSSSSKAVLPSNQTSLVESDIFVDMKNRCTEMRL